MTRTLIPIATALALLSLAACSSKKAKKSTATEPAEGEQTATDQAAPKGMPPGPYKIERTQLRTLTRKSAQGETLQWKSLDGIEVSDEGLKELYLSRGSFFVGFKATVKAAEQDCLIRWRAELIEGPTGRGPRVGGATGVSSARAGETITLSSNIALSAEDAQRVASASAGYWTLCGDDLPPVSAFDIAITNTGSEEVALGNAVMMQYTVLDLQRKAEKNAAPTRCHFDVVTEDIDAEGYTLNRDFASYSLGPAGTGQVKLRRTAFEGGGEADYKEAVVGRRSRIRDLSCRAPWNAKSATIEGITVKNLQMHRFTPEHGKPARAEWASYDHSAKFKNIIGKDCAFRIRYRVLDKGGYEMHKAPLLSEVLHLPKASSLDYRSDKQRLYVWLDQAAEVASLVVHEATPVRDCTTFDSKKVLANKAPEKAKAIAPVPETKSPGAKPIAK
jgi:hypothetical protein